MKTVLLRCQVMWVLTVFVFCAQNVVAQEQSGKGKECSNSTLHGTFGYSSTGTLLPEVGRQTFDGKGNTDATATLSTNGNPSTVTINGTYTVNRDCTGSMTLYVVQFMATVHLDFVIDDDGAEIRAIVTDANLVESRVYKKQFRGGRKE